ncbi:hypothetical protein CF15_01860 [Pyrodictium occultum]|uniref:Uncharacterized protein n=1 Tax=Pyrodictium occultum TaxID=2309 RepID=A0A0V8RU59_PYROC|nr:hypothetical protein [Pyrodictium occultum]KSW11601.1 hypothetical protein CF15_01860 [Pyrodictium occultum]
MDCGFRTAFPPGRLCFAGRRVDRGQPLPLGRLAGLGWSGERLEEMNLVTRLSRLASLSEPREPGPDPGVGREWAWQTPAYRLAAGRLLGLGPAGSPG